MAEDKDPIMIDCPHCGDRVQASPARPWLNHQYEYRIGIVQCLKCFNPLVAHQDFLGPQGPDGIEEYSEAQRLWPSPEAPLSLHIPEMIRVSLSEARKCLSCGTYTASVAMTGRAVEGMCHHFKTKKTTLFDGLKELLDREVIDKRLYQWADELRQHRNLAAHASGTSFVRQDAEDIFDFALAICNYVFVLRKKFEEFTTRTKKLA
jgi:rRNA maturation protein Nop10